MSDTIQQAPPAAPEDPGSHHEELPFGDYEDEEGNYHIVMPWGEVTGPVSVNEEPESDEPYWESASPRETDYGRETVEAERAFEDEDEENQRFYEISNALGEAAADFLIGQEEIDELGGEEDYRLAIPPARRQLEELRKVRPADYRTVMQEAGLDPTSELSEEDIATFYRSRMDRLTTNGKEKQEYMEQVREDFMTALTWAAEHGLPVDLDRARERVDAMRLKLFEPLLSEKVTKNDKDMTVGVYERDTDTVGMAHENLSPDADQHEARRTGFHELLHGIAGMRVIRNQDGTLTRQRGGLKTANLEHNGAAFRWLDEAVTERLAQILARHEALAEQDINFADMSAAEFFSLAGVNTIDASAYTDEQAAVYSLLDQIPAEEKPLQALLGAYFEDYEPGGYGDALARQPERSNLFRLLNSVASVRELDKVYQEKGAKRFLRKTYKTTRKESEREQSWVRRSRRQKLARRAAKRADDRARTEYNIAKWYGKRAA